MAIVQNPITGRSSGKFGTGIFSTQFSQNVIRSIPSSIKDSRSPGQLLQRQKFITATRFIRGCYPFIQSAFPSRKVRMNPFAFVLPSVLDAIIETGNAQRVESERAFNHFNPLSTSNLSFDADTDNQITVSFNPSQLWPDVSTGDVVVVMVHNEDLKESGTNQTTLQNTTSTVIVVSLPGHGEGDTVIVYAANQRLSALHPGTRIIQAPY